MMKSHADYMQFDETTETGRRDLLDALACDAVEIAEGLEPLRGSRFRQKGRLDAAIVRSKFMQAFVEFGHSGYATLATDARERYPNLGVLLRRLEELFEEPGMRDLWAALDDTRERRKAATEHGAR